MTKKKPTVTTANPGSRTMPPMIDRFRSTSDRPEERKAVDPSSNKRPEKWTRGGQGKKIKQDGKAKEYGKTKQDGKVITKEDEIHKIIGEVEAGGGGLSRAKRLTRSLRGMVVKKVDPRRVGEGDDEEDDEKEEEDEEEEDYDEDDDYQPNDDKHNNDKEDDDKEDDDKEDDEGRDSGGVYGVDYVFVPVLAGDDHEAEGDEAEDDQSEEDEEDNNEEDNDYEVDEAPPSTTKKTQKSKDNSEIKLRSILAERQVDGQRQYLVDWHPIWTPPSSLPALLLDEWTKNSNNHTSQRRTNKLPKVQPPTNDDEDALMWQLIEAVLHNFSAYMYPDPSQSSAADELARQLFRDGDWTFHLSPTNLRLFSRHQIKRGEQNTTAAQTLRRVFLAALRHKHNNPRSTLAHHDYDDVLVQYNGDICNPPRGSTRAPQPEAGVPIHTLIWPLFGLPWDLLSPVHDGSYANRAELPAHLSALQGRVDTLISACPYLMTLPVPLAFISLFRWGDEVSERFRGAASGFRFSVGGGVEGRYRDQIVDVIVEQAGWEDGRWSGEQVWRAFRAAKGYVREMSGDSIGAVGKGKGKGVRERKAGSGGSGKGGERKRKTVFEESGAGGKRRKAAMGAGKAAGKKGD